MTVYCSSPENEILATIQQLSVPDLLNAQTRAAAYSTSTAKYNKNTIRLIIQLAFAKHTVQIQNITNCCTRYT